MDRKVSGGMKGSEVDVGEELKGNFFLPFPPTKPFSTSDVWFFRNRWT